MDKNDKIMRREFKVARTVAVVSVIFALCLIPFNIVNYVIDFNTLDYIHVIKLNITILIVCFNSTLNPILYGLLNRDFRIAFKRLFKI